MLVSIAGKVDVQVPVLIVTGLCAWGEVIYLLDSLSFPLLKRDNDNNNCSSLKVGCNR